MDIELKIEADVSLTVAISAEAQLGPIAATVEDVGTRLIVKPVASGAGNLGKYDVSFGFKPPDGIGLAIRAEGISGGGFLDFDPPHYVGMMQLSFQNEFDVTAFGLITTKLPDGRPGFSLVISILAEFQPIQLASASR
jgi:hypothetical protein